MPADPDAELTEAIITLVACLRLACTQLEKALADGEEATAPATQASAGWSRSGGRRSRGHAPASGKLMQAA